jgi:hypothetical protein
MVANAQAREFGVGCGKERMVDPEGGPNVAVDLQCGPGGRRRSATPAAENRKACECREKRDGWFRDESAADFNRPIDVEEVRAAIVGGDEVEGESLSCQVSEGFGGEDDGFPNGGLGVGEDDASGAIDQSDSGPSGGAFGRVERCG